MTDTIVSGEMAHRDPTIPMAHRVEPSSNTSSITAEEVPIPPTANIPPREMAHRDPTIPMAHPMEPSSGRPPTPEPDPNRLLKSLSNLTKDRKPMAHPVPSSGAK